MLQWKPKPTKGPDSDYEKTLLWAYMTDRINCLEYFNSPEETAIPIIGDFHWNACERSTCRNYRIRTGCKVKEKLRVLVYEGKYAICGDYEPRVVRQQTQ